MENRIVRLGDVLTANYGKSLPQRDRVYGKIPVYGSSGITDYHNRSIADGPAVVVGRKGSIGSVFLTEGPFYPIDTTYYITQQHLKGLDIYFTYYLLQFLPLQEMNTDSAVPGLNRNNLYSIPVKIPDLPVQISIANILRTIDKKIQLNQQINNNLLQMMDLIWRHARKDRLTKLGDISSIRAGKRPIDRYEAFQEGLVPLVGGSGMMGWTSQSLVKTPIITTGRVGANIGTNGVTHMFDYPVWVSDNSLIITSNYLPVVFEMLRCDVDFSSLIHGTSQPLITQSDLKQYKVLLPDERRLNRINSYFLAITNLIEGNKAENRILSTVRDLMLPRLLAGDIDLSNIETVMNNG